jgi:hypothetical protein
LLKTIGYLVSSVSVLLLGILSWSSAAADPKMLACLLGGMALSVLGMLLRWLEYRKEKQQKK